MIIDIVESPHILLHLKRIYRLKKTRRKAVILNMKEPFAKRTKNSRDIKKSCTPISFHLRRPCCDRCDPDAILAILPRSCRDPAAIIVIHAVLRSIAIVL